jgi:hypothetical protein
MNIRSAALPLVIVAGATALMGYIREVVIAA